MQLYMTLHNYKTESHEMCLLRIRDVTTGRE